ncbi:MAG: hypothetical protein FWH20_04205 [Oscillospiraceae bacterium]|nr:hypothetical protein [Oscillospiraceae bacterium]
MKKRLISLIVTAALAVTLVAGLGGVAVYADSGLEDYWREYFTDAVGESPDPLDPDSFLYVDEDEISWSWLGDFRVVIGDFLLDEGYLLAGESEFTNVLEYEYTSVSKFDEIFHIFYNDGTGVVEEYIFASGGEDYWRNYFTAATGEPPSFFRYTNENDMWWEWDDYDFVNDIRGFLETQGYNQTNYTQDDSDEDIEVTRVFKDNLVFAVIFHDGDGNADSYLFKPVCEACLEGDHEDCYGDGCFCVVCYGGGGGVCGYCYFDEHYLCDYKIYGDPCDCPCNNFPDGDRQPLYLRAGMRYYLMDIDRLLSSPYEPTDIYGFSLVVGSNDFDSGEGYLHFASDKGNLYISFDEAEVQGVPFQEIYTISYTHDTPIFGYTEDYDFDLHIYCGSGRFMLYSLTLFDDEGNELGGIDFGAGDPCGGNFYDCVCGDIISGFDYMFGYLDDGNYYYAMDELYYVFNNFLGWDIPMTPNLDEEYVRAILGLIGEDCVGECIIDCISCFFDIIFDTYHDYGLSSDFFFYLMERVAVPIAEAIEAVNVEHFCPACDRVPCICMDLFNALGEVIAVYADNTETYQDFDLLIATLQNIRRLMGWDTRISPRLAQEYYDEIGTLIVDEPHNTETRHPAEDCIWCAHMNVGEGIVVVVDPVTGEYKRTLTPDLFDDMVEFIVDRILLIAVDDVNDENPVTVGDIYEEFCDELVYAMAEYGIDYIDQAEINAAFALTQEAIDLDTGYSVEWHEVRSGERQISKGAKEEVYLSLKLDLLVEEEARIYLYFVWTNENEVDEFALMRVNAYVDVYDEELDLWVDGGDGGLDWSALRAILQANGGEFRNNFDEPDPVPTGISDVRGFGVVVVVLIGTFAILWGYSRRREFAS